MNKNKPDRLYLRVSKDIHYFVCSDNMIDHRGKCPGRHYVRADAVEQVVTLELRRMAMMLQDAVRQHANQ